MGKASNHRVRGSHAIAFLPLKLSVAMGMTIRLTLALSMPMTLVPRPEDRDRGRAKVGNRTRRRVDCCRALDVDRHSHGRVPRAEHAGELAAAELQEELRRSDMLGHAAELELIGRTRCRRGQSQ